MFTDAAYIKTNKMETTKFKTNIKCDACVAKVTPALNETVGENNWEVDLKDPNKTLTINTGTSEEKVIAALKSVGYSAEKS